MSEQDMKDIYDNVDKIRIMIEKYQSDDKLLVTRAEFRESLLLIWNCLDSLADSIDIINNKK